MPALILIVGILLIVWILFGRGFLIAYKHDPEEVIPVPIDSTNESIMELLKKDLTYHDMKELYYDANGDICIVGKYDTYALTLSSDAVCSSLHIKSSVDFKVEGKENHFLLKAAYWGYRADRKNHRIIEELECLRAYITKIFHHDAPIDARKKYEKMRQANKYRTVTVLGLTLAMIILFIAALNESGLLASNSDKIQDSYLTQYSSDITIGEAFDDFFSNPQWYDYKDGASEYVDFKGGCTWYDEPATMVITFVVYDDEFYVDKISINGKDMIFYNSLLTEIYDSYGK